MVSGFGHDDNNEVLMIILYLHHHHHESLGRFGISPLTCCKNFREN